MDLQQNVNLRKYLISWSAFWSGVPFVSAMLLNKERWSKSNSRGCNSMSYFKWIWFVKIKKLTTRCKHILGEKNLKSITASRKTIIAFAVRFRCQFGSWRTVSTQHLKLLCAPHWFLAQKVLRCV